MRYTNTKYKFSYEIPEGFEVLDRSDYSRYHIDEVSTLEILIKYDDANTKSISINRDDTFESVKDYEDLIALNMANMKKMGMKILSKERMDLTNGRRLDRLYTAYHGLKYVTYFSNIRNVMIAASVEIIEPQDENEQNLLMLFSSIEEA